MAIDTYALDCCLQLALADGKRTEGFAPGSQRIYRSVKGGIARLDAGDLDPAQNIVAAFPE